MSADARFHSAPRQCPVCGDTLALTRLGCRSCGTELSGSFEACEYCSLAPEDREMLAVFLQSRGNMRDLERHLGVSYPTARARFEGLLGRLGLSDGAPAGSVEGAGTVPAEGRATGPAEDGLGTRITDVEVLARLARGEIDVDTADGLLASMGGGNKSW